MNILKTEIRKVKRTCRVCGRERWAIDFKKSDLGDKYRVDTICNRCCSKRVKEKYYEQKRIERRIFHKTDPMTLEEYTCVFLDYEYQKERWKKYVKKHLEVQDRLHKLTLKGIDLDAPCCVVDRQIAGLGL